ncbi:MAG: (E)-4-hydroxy-3-methylbut-2-enyl-diphosphate synthase (flavodoxin), partial [uncultured Friedmanniella sp.]
DYRPRPARPAPARPRPAPQDAQDQGRQGRRRRRRPRQRAVHDHDADLRHQRHAAADRRADRDRLRHRPGGGAQPGRRGRAAGHRRQVPDPGDRRHPLPAQVRLRGHRRGLRGG